MTTEAEAIPEFVKTTEDNKSEQRSVSSGVARSAASALLRADQVGIEDVATIEDISIDIVDQIRQKNLSPEEQKVLKIRFTITEAATMVGCSPQRIRNAEKDASHTWGSPELTANGRRAGYTLKQINLMRKEFGALPWRSDDEDDPLIIAMQNFKGGVGKSICTVHLAHSLLLKGYRVLVVDCDPQATTTSLFGLSPDLDVQPENTLTAFYSGQQADLNYAICETSWDQCKLIPTNLHFYGMEYAMHEQIHNNPLTLRKLREGLDEIKHNFDVILLDPPPALGVISLTVLNAADAIIVPVRPSVIDFSSTSNFFSMLRETLETLKEHNLAKSFKFLRILVNDMDDSKSAHEAIHSLMDGQFGEFLLSRSMKDSAEIDNAMITGNSVYELTKPATSKKTHERCKKFLDAVNDEIELLIRRTWPSHVAKMREEGIIG